MSIIRLLFHLVILLIYAVVMLLLIVELMIPPLPDSTIIFESYLLPASFLTLFVIGFTLIPFNIARRQVKSVKSDFEETIQLINKNVLQHGL